LKQRHAPDTALVRRGFNERTWVRKRARPASCSRLLAGDTLVPSTPSQPETDFRGVYHTTEDDVSLHGGDDYTDYVNFNTYGNKLVQEDGLVTD
jgi:hypothetical protein